MAAGKWNMQKASGGVASITVADGVSNTAVVLPDSGTVATTDNIVGFKNYIINGNFDIWQYDTSQTANGYYSDDRWFNGSDGSTKIHSQVVCTDVERALFNASKFSRTVVTSVVGVGSHVVKRQAIEDVTKLAGKTVTLSFWAKADTTKNIWVEFKQLFGTGGSPSTVVTGIYGQPIQLTSAWQRKTITLTIPSIIGKTLGTDGVHTTSTELQFWFDAGSASIARIPTGIQQSGTFDIAQVQLEEGSVATPFENRPYWLELILCQRYYEANIKCGYLGVTSTANMSYGGTFSMLHKRVPPTVTFASDAGHFNFTTGFPTVGEITLSGFRAYKNTTVANVQAFWSVLLNASAEL